MFIQFSIELQLIIIAAAGGDLWKNGLMMTTETTLLTKVLIRLWTAYKLLLALAQTKSFVPWGQHQTISPLPWVV